ncbi:Gfo/Idh/MocA family protein [Dactylosporangium sp. NPDC048998]|uniref:Gfo/Idh/MocA family protein n=1 Tax=Dactylosporangium sp. NPDC048998 TaxID=3363976 RepID=UPI003717100E
MKEGLVELLVVGAGQRGAGYARHAVRTGRARVTAVAEPDPARRLAFAREFGIPAERALEDWARLREHDGRLADAAVVATQDTLHADPAVLLAGQGYHLLLEKPMAPTEPEARRIAEAVTRSGVMAAVCHVLRYTPYTSLLKELLDAGRIGRLVSIQHLEPVGWWHQAHSFVRGNWRSAASSSPMLLSKACHDIDWLMYLGGQPVRRVSSFGGLAHFRADQRPAGAADRCLDCSLEPECAYSAPRLYLGRLETLEPGERVPWPVSVVSAEADRAAVLDALRTGPYGRCVYACDNDVVDHQVVSMELADGATVSLTMTAFTPAEQRKTRLFGTHGYLDGDGARLRVVDFRTGEDTTIEVAADPSADHSDGDAALVEAFVSAVATGDAGLLRSDVATSLAGHRVVWAAERARHTGTVVTL